MKLDEYKFDYKGISVKVKFNQKDSIWQKPGYRDEGWIIKELDDSYELYEFFDGGENIFYQSYASLFDAVIAAETELT